MACEVFFFSSSSFLPFPNLDFAFYFSHGFGAELGGSLERWEMRGGVRVEGREGLKAIWTVFATVLFNSDFFF